MVVNALMISIPSISNVVMVCALFLMIFAITGINLFKGRFFYCSIPDNINIRTKTDCLEAGGSWLNMPENFDNIFNAMMSLFDMMSTEGWQNIMRSGMD